MVKENTPRHHKIRPECGLTQKFTFFYRSLCFGKIFFCLNFFSLFVSLFLFVSISVFGWSLLLFASDLQQKRNRVISPRHRPPWRNLFWSRRFKCIALFQSPLQITNRSNVNMLYKFNLSYNRLALWFFHCYYECLSIFIASNWNQY